MGFNYLSFRFNLYFSVIIFLSYNYLVLFSHFFFVKDFSYYIYFAVLFNLFSYLLQSQLIDFSSSKPNFRLLYDVSICWVISFIFLSLLGFIFNVSNNYSRLYIGFFSVSTTITSCALFFITRYMIWIIGKRRSETIVVIGTNNKANNIISQLKVDSKIKIIHRENHYHDEIINELIEQNNLSKILIFDDKFGIKKIEKSKKFLEKTTAEIIVFNNNINYELLDQRIKYTYMGYDCIIVPQTRNISKKGQLLVKRAIDFFGSAFLLILFLPLLICIASLIKISSRGPIFFIQSRKGLHGKSFNIFKFRSMHYEEDNLFEAAEIDDKRITKIGHFIRKTSIDELPQLVNVLLGDMSLVGPRPHAIEMDNDLKKKISKYMSRAKVKPGMTGLAQIEGLRGGANLDDLRKRINSDLRYIKKWSIWLDIKILIKTIPALLKSKAY